MAGFSPACTTLASLISDKPKNEEDMFETVADLLDAYPEWKCPEDNCWDERFWRDVMKTATPKGLKAKLCFNTELLRKLVDAELDKLLVYRNIIKHILSVVEPKGNKKLILELTANLSGMSTTFITGGGMTLATQRVIYLYEREGSVTCTKRRRRPPDDTSDLYPASRKAYYDMASMRAMAALSALPHHVVGLTAPLDSICSQQPQGQTADTSSLLFPSTQPVLHSLSSPGSLLPFPTTATSSFKFYNGNSTAAAPLHPSALYDVPHFVSPAVSASTLASAVALNGTSTTTASSLPPRSVYAPPPPPAPYSLSAPLPYPSLPSHFGTSTTSTAAAPLSYFNPNYERATALIKAEKTRNDAASSVPMLPKTVNGTAIVKAEDLMHLGGRLGLAHHFNNGIKYSGNGSHSSNIGGALVHSAHYSSSASAQTTAAGAAAATAVRGMKGGGYVDPEEEEIYQFSLILAGIGKGQSGSNNNISNSSDHYSSSSGSPFKCVV